MKNTCLVCKRLFEAPPSRGRKYCSQECYHKTVGGSGNPNWRGGKKSLKCDYCNSQYEVDPTVESRFCSRKCSSFWWAEQYHEKKRVKKVCLICDKEFFVFPSRERRKVCSQKCARDLKSEQMKGDGNYFWEGGKSKLPYSSDFFRKRKKIRKRDGYKCAICKKRAKDVHHIDGDKSNSDDKNLITLCKKCHKEVHMKMLKGENSPLRVLGLI